MAIHRIVRDGRMNPVVLVDVSYAESGRFQHADDLSAWKDDFVPSRAGWYWKKVGDERRPRSMQYAAVGPFDSDRSALLAAERELSAAA